MSPQRFDWNDIGFTGLATVESHSVMWKIVQILGWDGFDWSNPCLWGQDMDICHGSPEEAEPFASVFLKWDGCGSWDFHDQVHTCGDGGRSFSRLITQVYETTGEILPTWDAECAGMNRSGS